MANWSRSVPPDSGYYWVRDDDLKAKNGDGILGIFLVRQIYFPSSGKSRMQILAAVGKWLDWEEYNEKKTKSWHGPLWPPVIE